jgi:hypothetical protein
MPVRAERAHDKAVGPQPASERTRAPHESRRPTDRSGRKATSPPTPLLALQRAAGNPAVNALIAGNVAPASPTRPSSPSGRGDFPSGQRATGRALTELVLPMPGGRTSERSERPSVAQKSAAEAARDQSAAKSTQSPPPTPAPAAENSVSTDALVELPATPTALTWRRHDVMALQRLGGNAAVAAMLGTKSVQREPNANAPAATGERKKIDKALESAKSPSPDSSLVKDIDDFGEASKDERIKLARLLVYNYTAFFGPRDRSCLTRICESFGEDLKYIADKDPFLLEKCLKEWPGLMFDLKPVKNAGDAFKKSISVEARQNLGDNITYLKNEKKRLFGVEGPSPEAVLEDSKRQSERAAAMVLVAEKILNLRKRQKEMLDKVVGFKYQEHNPVAPTAPVKFTPGKPPQHKHDTEPTYDSLNESWDAAAMLTGLHATKYPWLFGILKDPDTADARLQELVNQKNNPTAARVQIMTEMQTQITRAEAVENDYKFKELRCEGRRSGSRGRRDRRARGQLPGRPHPLLRRLLLRRGGDRRHPPDRHPRVGPRLPCLSAAVACRHHGVRTRPAQGARVQDGHARSARCRARRRAARGADRLALRLAESVARLGF